MGRHNKRRMSVGMAAVLLVLALMLLVTFSWFTFG
jgi:hypothetical protein